MPELNVIPQVAETPVAEIERIFRLQKENQYNVARSNARERIRKLNRLHQAVLHYRPEIKEAMYADFKKPSFEVDAVEVYPVTGAIKHTKSYLRRWMRPKRVPTPIAFTGSSSWIHYEPKGVCLVVSPWNFPFNLTFIPLVSAIAAGNCVILKPSEHTPHSSALIKKIVEGLFDENEVAVLEGAIETSRHLLDQPFNHIFFTGSPRVGKIVMAAAAKHLASVTLELGGKSPTVIDETADIKTAAVRLVRGKLANSGQVCIAPDYILVQEKVRDEFLNAVNQTIQEFLGDDPIKSDSYARMVNEKQYNRVVGYLENALENGARIEQGGKLNKDALFIEPTILTGVSRDCDIMQEEIFGPLLPVNTFGDLEEAIRFINAGKKPLTMNIFSKKKKNIERLIQETRAGGTCINHAQLHFYNHDLPFGGINNSGIGRAHGWYGFETFSHARSVYKQNFWGPTELMKPPYTKFKEWLIDFTIKWM